MRPLFMKPQFYLAMIYSFQALAQSVPQYDASGRAGEGLRHGYSYQGQSSSTGSDGRNGGHAGAADVGQDGGSIDFRMNRVQGHYVINGLVHFPDGKQSTVQNTKVSLAETGNIVLDVTGGVGGYGGDGGYGEDGGRGYDGADATRYSTGGNGGNGGDGGDAGAGTSGARGGKGGSIKVELPIQDTALLMLVDSRYKGGRGGDKGKHGQPGSGGSGGSGGSSYSWTETHYDTESYQDSDGNSQTRTVTRTTHHSNSGGMSGSSGSDGRRQTGILTDGDPGPDGSLTIRVIDEKGEVKTYSQRYDLKLVDYRHESEDNDGTLEPGERVLVKNLIVQNTGGMPTPPYTPIRIFLTNGAYSVADSAELVIPKSLAPGESYKFSDKNLSFVIQNNVIKTIGEDRLVWDDGIKPLAEMTEVNRQFQGFSTVRPIQITFPIEIESVVAARSLAVGETSKILLRVKNLSTRDFGSESELKRALEIAIRRAGGDLASNGYTLQDMNGKPWNAEEGLLKAISKLKAGESTVIEGQIRIAADAETYRAMDLGFTLGLGTPSGQNQRTDVQKRHVVFRVSQTYQVDKNADILLVVNSTTSREMIQGFQALAKSANLKVNIWDISYYGGMALTKILESGSSLAQDFAGKTMVVLNNAFKTSTGTVQAYQLIAQQELVEAAARKGMNAFFLGGTAQEMADSVSLRSADPEQETRVDIAKWRLWGKPKGKTLEKAAHSKLAELLKAEPLGNFQVAFTFEPEIIKKGMLGIGKVWSLGNLKISRSLDAQDAQIVTLTGHNDLGLRPEDLKTRDVQVSMFMALPVKKRVQLINSLLAADKPSAESVFSMQMIVESMLLDIAQEQAQARTLKYSFGTNARIRARLPKLQQLYADVETLKPETFHLKAQSVWVELITGLREMVNEKSRWWHKLVPMGTASEFSAETRKLISKLEAKVYPRGTLFTGKNDFSKQDMKEMRSAAEPRDRTPVQGQGVVNNEVQSNVRTGKEAAQGQAALQQREDQTLARQKQLQESIQSLKSGISCKSMVN